MQKAQGPFRHNPRAVKEERPSDDPERLRELASEAVSGNRAALRARAIAMDVEPPAIFGVGEQRRRSPDEPDHGSDRM